MAQLAVKTLIETHERTLNAWRKERPKAVERLASPVKTEPVYRPLTPNETEQSFYRERRQRIHALPPVRLLKVERVPTPLLSPSRYRAVLEDTRRMVGVTKRVRHILNDSVDWPDAALALVRAELQAQFSSQEREARPPDERDDPAAVLDLLSQSTIASVAADVGLEEATLHRALERLQRRLHDALPAVVGGHGVERYATTHITVPGDETLLVDALPAYDERVREAVATVHRRRAPGELRGGTPLLVSCTPETLREAYRIEGEAALDTER